ncbi:uncharacterized protein LOC127792047 isoform X3 [Diospyros lotus]|uniref:uncharacterized protein LOC127792047 isoform X3 n=1 Tax=Diospyros lotus TaxID=55363 RepID=UPI00225A2D4D|nr:uncharacterized protein LOC127792047 isoform X3 [Diospyros lotus]
MMSSDGEYSCETAAKTLEWIHAIIDFLKPYRFFLDSHVVNFFKDRQWEAVDVEWMDCLRREPVENLVQIPSGVVQDYWPATLKKFILTSRSLAIPREQADLQKIEALASIINSMARTVGASTVVDVGAGQGYLAQVLGFEYQLSVIAIDACSHHGRITDARAERIKKHYAAKMRNSKLEETNLSIPKTVTCRVLSTDMLKALSYALLQKDDIEHSDLDRQLAREQPRAFSNSKVPSSSFSEGSKSSLLLVGLHACGDLSVTMLRTFLECSEVKAVISIGCCYNLLSEEGANTGDSQCGFPMSKGVKHAGFLLGKNLRDLACQSAERWKDLGSDAGLHNFELHSLRAAFQMFSILKVLLRYYPEILITSPAIGRQGKALRRRQNRRTLESYLQHENIRSSDSSSGKNFKEGNCLTINSAEAGIPKKKGSAFSTDALFHGFPPNGNAEIEEAKHVDKYLLFENFCQSGVRRLGLHHLKEINLAGLWKETEPFVELIGPFWSLRAALGPVSETLLLLDRLLFLQEQGNAMEAVMLPVFDPKLSPRNVALIAKKI